MAINAGSPNAGQKALAASFEAETGAKVVYEAYEAVDWNGFFAKVLTQLAAGVPLDCAYVATEGMQLFSHSGLSMPLDSFVMRDKAELKPYFADIHPLLTECEMYQGSLMMLPTEFNAGDLYYDTTLFEKAGIPRPPDDWTEADFINIVKHWANVQDVGWDWVVLLWGSWSSWMYANGSNLLTEGKYGGGDWLWSTFYPGQPARSGGWHWGEPTANAPGTVEALQLMIDLKQQGISPSPDAGGGGTLQGLFASNHIATTIGGGFWAGGLYEAGMKPNAYDVMYFPKWKVQKHLIGVGGFTVLEKSKNHDLAWEWIKHSTTADAISTVYGPRAPDKGNTSTPARRSVLSAAGYAPTGPKHWDVFYGTLDNYPNTTPIPAPFYYEALATAFLARTTQGFSSGNAQSALNGLQADLEKLYKA
jgi:ABC-type glycerol-3-phosphate transport system substrate-binding protein